MSTRTWKVQRAERFFTPKGTDQEFHLVVKEGAEGYVWEVTVCLVRLPITIDMGRAKKLWQAKLYARRAAEKKAKTLPW